VGGFRRAQSLPQTFKKECTIDIAIGAVTVVTSSVSIAMSWALPSSLRGHRQAICDIAETINHCRAGETTEGVALGQMDFVVDLVKKRTESKEAGEGQKAAKAAEAGKEPRPSCSAKSAVNSSPPFPATTKTAKEYNGKNFRLEKDAGQMYKKLQDFPPPCLQSDGADAR